MADPRPADDLRTDPDVAGAQAGAEPDSMTTPTADAGPAAGQPSHATDPAADQSPIDQGQTAIDGLATGSAEPKPKTRRGRKPAATKSRGVELVLTVTGNIDGSDWRAEVAHAGKTVISELAIPTSAVSAAAKDLHPDIAEAIEDVLSAAREQQRSRVEALQAQLEAARQALAGLEE
jgi:hypothetical protein